MVPPAAAGAFDSDRYRVVFTDESFDEIAATASEHDRDDVTDAAGFVHALRGDDRVGAPDRVALTAADSELHLWYRAAGSSQASLAEEIVAIGTAYLALLEDREQPAVGDLRVVATVDDGTLEWHYRREWLAAFRHGELDDEAVFERVVDTVEADS